MSPRNPGTLLDRRNLGFSTRYSVAPVVTARASTTSRATVAEMTVWRAISGTVTIRGGNAYTDENERLFSRKNVLLK